MDKRKAKINGKNILILVFLLFFSHRHLEECKVNNPKLFWDTALKFLIDKKKFVA